MVFAFVTFFDTIWHRSYFICYLKFYTESSNMLLRYHANEVK